MAFGLEDVMRCIVWGCASHALVFDVIFRFRDHPLQMKVYKYKRAFMHLQLAFFVRSEKE